MLPPLTARTIKIGGKKMANQKIRIKLKAYEHNLIDRSRRAHCGNRQAHGRPGVRAPFPFPPRRRSSPSCVRRTSTRTAANSSRRRTHKRLIDIHNPNPAHGGRHDEARSSCRRRDRNQAVTKKQEERNHEESDRGQKARHDPDFHCTTARLVPVTVIEAGPCTVVQKKTVETDGYEAVQVGFGDLRRKARREAGQQARDRPFQEGGRCSHAAICASSAWTTPRPTR